VKKYSDGKASTHIHSLIPGDSLFFLGSIKAYPWKTNEFQHITLIAGGAGITPLYQLTSSILSNPQEKTAITLVFGINSDRDALFRNEFSEWEKKFPDRFKVVYTVSNPGPNSPFPKGYVTKELLENLVGKKGSEKVFVCGPPGLEKALMGGRGNQGGILNELGFEKEQIYKF
jgi:cytochrome-b5 reductase